MFESCRSLDDQMADRGLGTIATNMRREITGFYAKDWKAGRFRKKSDRSLATPPSEKSTARQMVK